MNKLVKQVSVVIKSSSANSKYIVFNDPVNGQLTCRDHPIFSSNLIMLQYFILKKLMMEKKGANLPAIYEQLVLESDLFKSEIYEYVINLPIEEQGANRHLNSRIKRSFITLLGTLCYNDPTQIPKLIENKVLEKMIDMIMKCLPVD